MSAEPFELIDMSVPVFLHFDMEKFWEIKLDDVNHEVVVRCGKLTMGSEETSTVQSIKKGHTNLGEAITYLEKHVNLKLSKGYKILTKEIKKTVDLGSQTSSRGGYSINIIAPGENKPNNLKRKADDSLMHDNLKQTKITSKSEQLELDEALAKSLQDEEDRKHNKPERIEVERSILSTAFNTSNETDDSPTLNSTNSYTNFKGEYLVRENHKGGQFYKIQVLKKNLKIEKGFENDASSHEKEYSFCKDLNDAVEQAQKLLSEYTAKGYKAKNHKFVYDFQESELNFKRNFHHNMLGSAPASPVRGQSPARDQSRNNSQTLSYLGDNNTLGVNDDDYSDTSRRSAFYDDEDDDSGTRTRSRSRSRARSASANADMGDDDEDNTFTSGSLGDYPLGKPPSKATRPVLLAHKWENEDPKGWYVSEKLDGVRCYWNGRTMWSRNGKQYFPPKFFTKDFPKSPLDGELWTGRSTFQKCVSVVRKHNPIDSEWKTCKYMVFDAPELNEPFKNRYKKMKEVFGKIDSPYIELHEHYICRGRDHLDEELQTVQSLGGEGLMIRNPEGYYEGRRSKTLLKVKTFDDDEAVIIGHEPGRNKYLGQTGALRVRNSKGIEFSVGSGMDDAMRARPPKIGTKITYKHQGVSNNGIPRFPTFMRIYTGH